MTKRTPQLESALLEGFACGRSILSLCREHGITPGTFHQWKRADPDFARRYDEARPDHARSLIDEALEIAEVPTSTWVEEISGGEASSADHIRHARLRIQTRLRIAQIHQRAHDAALLREAAGRPPAQPSRAPAQAAAERQPESSQGTPKYADFAEALEANYQRLVREGPSRPRARPSYLETQDPHPAPGASPGTSTTPPTDGRASATLAEAMA